MHVRHASRLIGMALMLETWVSSPALAQQRMPDWPAILLPPGLPANTAPMEVRSMEVRARIAGLQVETTATLTFRNPNNRNLEGELIFPLPDGASVTAYALDVNGQLVDGVVVPKETARVAFETEVRRGVDPGLVEQVAGNVYRTRIYPLPPQGTRTIRLRYVAELPADENGDAAWHLPLPREQTIGTLSLHIEVAQGAVTPAIGGFGNLRFDKLQDVWVAETTLQAATPGEDLWVSLPKLPAQVAAVERTPSGEFAFAISDRPDLTSAPAKPPRVLGLAWDASGSRAGLPHDREVDFLRALFQTWKDVDVELLLFRNRPDAIQAFQVRNGQADALLAALREAAYDGGTDLAAAADAMRDRRNVDAWLLFTDGFDTLASDPPQLPAAPVYAVVSQTAAQRELLRQLCGERGGDVIDLQRLRPPAAAAAILAPAPRLVAVHGTGVADVQGLGDAVHGRVAVHGHLTAASADLVLEYSGGQRSAPVHLAQRQAPDGTLLDAVWAAHRVSQLATRAEANADELLALGRRYGLVSPVTSLIVLERVDQYVRHDIEPPASQPEWRAEWQRQKKAQARQEKSARTSKLEHVVGLWQARVAWWEQRRDVGKDFRWKEQESLQLAGTPPASPAPRMAARASTAAASAEWGFADTHASPALDAAPAPAATAVAAEAVDVGGDGLADDSSGPAANARAITVKAWDPDVPYLRAIQAAAPAERYAVYLRQRARYATSPAFFVDCGDYFLREGDAPHGLAVLTSLADLRLEDAALLRVLAWRLQQAGELDRAVAILRQVARLRPEEPQSLRDLALALAERGKARLAASDLEEALQLLEQVVMGDWARFEEIEVIALEEFNALAAWADGHTWKGTPPRIPVLDGRLRQNLDVDVRVVMTWDADATDVDLHVREPSGEEAYYSHNRTTIGGLVSRDFTQGYGPEEYLVRRAQPGEYRVLAHYYGSSQQTVIGPATVTATVITDFGRATERRDVLTLRVDKPRDEVEIGRVRIGTDRGGVVPMPATKDAPQPGPATEREAFRALRPGMGADPVRAAVGAPLTAEPVAHGGGEVWNYEAGARKYRVTFGPDHTVAGVFEILPGGAVMLLAQ